MCCNRTCDTNETSSFIFKNIRLDVSIDGADDVDPNLCLIKGNVIFAYLNNNYEPRFTPLLFNLIFIHIHSLKCKFIYLSYHSTY